MNELELQNIKADIQDIWKYVDENKAYTQYNDKRIDQMMDNQTSMPPDVNKIYFLPIYTFFLF